MSLTTTQVTIVKEFNDILTKFTAFIKIHCPHSSKATLFKINTYMNSDKLGPIKHFVTHVLPYKPRIILFDTDYFMSSTLADNDDLEAGELEKVIKATFRSIPVTEQTKCSEFMNDLVCKCYEYLIDILDEQNFIIIDTIDLLIITFSETGMFDVHDITTVLTHAIEKRFIEASNCVTRLLDPKPV